MTGARIALTLTGTGTVTREEAIAAVNRQVAEGVWTFGILYDIRAAETLPKPGEIFDILDYVRRQVGVHGRRGPVAIVATRSPHEQRVRTHATLTDPCQRLATFTDVDEASRWLAEQMSAGAS